MRKKQRLVLAQDEHAWTRQPLKITAAEQAPQTATSSHAIVTVGRSTLLRQVAARALVLATSLRRFGDTISSMMPAGYENSTVPTEMAIPTRLFIRHSRLPSGPFFSEEGTVHDLLQSFHIPLHHHAQVTSSAPISFAYAVWCGCVLWLHGSALWR